MGQRGQHRGTPGQFQPLSPPGHGPATLAGCLSVSQHHAGRTEEPPRVPSLQGTPKSTARQSLGRAHLEAAGVPVVPGTFGLFLLLCGGNTEGKSLQGSRGNPRLRKQLLSWQCPLHNPATSTGLWSAPAPPTPPRSWGQPSRRVPKATLRPGTPTLVLQGLQPLLGLVVQLLQVRGPCAGEEDVVGTFLARRVLHAQPLVTLALGSACGDRGLSWAGGTRPRCHPSVPTHGGRAQGGDSHPGMTNQALETPREIPSHGSARPVDIPEPGCLHWFCPHHQSGAGMWEHPPNSAFVRS